MEHVARPLPAARQRRPQPPAAAVAGVAVVVLLRRMAELHILAEVDIQFLVVDTVYLVTVVGTEVDRVTCVLEQDTEWVQWDTGLVVVVLRYIVHCSPCFSLCLCSCSVNINGTNKHVKVTTFRFL